MGNSSSRVSEIVRLFVRALNGKRLELEISKWLEREISQSVPGHVLLLGLKGQSTGKRRWCACV